MEIAHTMRLTGEPKFLLLEKTLGLRLLQRLHLWQFLVAPSLCNRIVHTGIKTDDFYLCRLRAEESRNTPLYDAVVFHKP
jgi:hypothetical protein